MTEVQIWDCCQVAKKEIYTVALLGSTGKVGGWVLEMALERGHTVRALVRNLDNVDDYSNYVQVEKLFVIEGNVEDRNKLRQTIKGCDVIISTLGSSSKQKNVLTKAAECLFETLSDMSDRPRVIWMTTIGINEAISQGHQYGCMTNCCPSCTICGGCGCCGIALFCWLVPHVIEQDAWKDMESSEDVIRREEFLRSKSVIVRPTNMRPVNANKAFTEKWRKQGGENTNYLVKMADESPPNMWINRRTVATFLLDCVGEHKYDGKAVSLFQGEPTKLNQIEPKRHFHHRT